MIRTTTNKWIDNTFSKLDFIVKNESIATAETTSYLDSVGRFFLSEPLLEYLDIISEIKPISTLNWASPIPLAISASRVWIIMLTIGLAIQIGLVAIKKSNRILDLVNLILAVTVDITMYTWNILEAGNFSEGTPNQSDPAIGQILSHFLVLVLTVVVSNNTVIAISDSKEWSDDDSENSYDFTIN